MNHRGGWALIKRSWASWLQYRSFFFVIAFGWMIPPLIYLFVWSTAAEPAPIAGMTPPQFVAYYLVLILVNQLTLAQTNWTVGDVIRMGDLNSWLLKPMSPLYNAIASEVAGKVVMMTFVVPVSIALAIVLRPELNATPIQVVLFFVALGGAWLLRFFWGLWLACLAFWATRADALLALHGKRLPDVLPVAPHVEHRIPSYDLSAILIEAELLLDWFLPRLHAAMPDSERDSFRKLWRELLQPAIDAPATWVLRDFHSPNLLWLARRKEIARLGLLDFQDAVIGPAAYDVASLLQDARVDIPEQLELALLGRYVRGRRQSAPDFDPASFIKTYVTLAAQRASKILGIFARLDLRDGKPQYLRHMPRVWGYLQRSLGHPALESLNAWYIAHVPALNAV